KRKIAEEKLKEKERRYRSLFERSIDPIFLANDQLRLVDVNDSFLGFFKCTREEALSFTIGSIFSDKNDFEYFGTTLMVLKQIRDFEVPLIGKDGEKKTCLINCVFIPDQASECYQGIIHDLTMRKKAERDMIIAERLSMTGKIARTIAHEVRNPLTNLNLALEQLKDEMPQDNESVKLYSDIIERNIERIEQLIGEMLNSSKPKELRLELTPITEVIEETIALTIDRLNLNQIRLEKVYAENLPRILLDKEKMKIAFLNIVINAVEAMEQGVGILTISTILNNGSIVVKIADNGKGIAHDDIEKLFDPFHTAKPGGMGLGLTSTKNILSSHNAEVEVSSRLNEGTTFLIFFKLPEY
ncbi:MAG TPA: ATP-binding protein, partial [Cyclobacteriaceae bacterium]|nr:ATP-binding protein [Cyclobacteriaceae bacterium]